MRANAQTRKTKQPPELAMIYGEGDYNRAKEIEEKRKRLSDDFDAGLLPFTYPQLKSTGTWQMNIKWCRLMMRAIENVLTSTYTLNADQTNITSTVRVAHNVTNGGFDADGPERLTDAFYRGVVPIYMPQLEEVGISLNQRQKAQLKNIVINELLMWEDAI